MHAIGIVFRIGTAVPISLHNNKNQEDHERNERSRAKRERCGSETANPCDRQCATCGLTAASARFREQIHDAKVVLRM